jgi:hypothetical protein
MQPEVYYRFQKVTRVYLLLSHMNPAELSHPLSVGRELLYLPKLHLYLLLASFPYGFPTEILMQLLFFHFVGDLTFLDLIIPTIFGE